MSHVWDGPISTGTPPTGRPSQNRQAGDTPVRSVYRHSRRHRRDGVCSVTGCKRQRPRFVDTRPPVAAGNRAAASCGAWCRAVGSVDGGASSRRCADRRRRGAALQGACRGDCRNLGRPAGLEFHRHQTAGLAGRSCGCCVLADQVWRHCRYQRGAGSLADRIAAFGAGPRRCQGPRRPALAGGIVPIPRQTARNMGGAP